jgi:single-strand DNA-binding protein
MNSTTQTGNVTRDPELKFLQNGQASARLSIAVNRRWQNKQTQEWEEKVSYFDIQAYGALAENVANTVTRGTRITVTGQLEQRSWETPEGDKRSVVEIKADDIGVSLAYATAIVNKIESTTFKKSPAPRTAPDEDFAF